MSEVPLYLMISRPSSEIRVAFALGTYRGTSLIRNTPLLGPCSRTIPRVLRWSYGGDVSHEHGTKVDVRLRGKGNPNSHGARPVHQIIS